MKELIEKLNEASRAYYQEDREIISNYEYDRLYDELVRLEEISGVVLANSPTRSVGYTVLGSLEKVRHEAKILSLDKTKKISKLESFLEIGEGVLSWKLDGLIISLKYENGELIQAVTRGNGEVGEDVTHNAKVFKNIPVKINFKGNLTVKGEAVIKYSDFAKINEALPDEEKYKNPRNLTSGTVRQLNNKIAADRSVMFYAFPSVAAEGTPLSDSKLERKRWLEEIGFETVYGVKVNKENVGFYVEEFKQNTIKNDFASDGLVLTYDSVALSESLGVTAKFPKDSIAYKWADELRETHLLSVEWNTSRTGLINPVAIFEPVELEGTTVNKASLHNLSYIESLGLGIGDTVTVYKANMIIPQIAENFTRSGGLPIPIVCPVCGGEASVVRQKEGKALYCLSISCEAQLVRGLTHFVSRDAMNIEGFSEATIEKFVKNGFLESYVDIYSLGRYEAEILQMDGFGEKSFSNLINSIEKSKSVSLPNFINALGINQVGLNNAKLLCERFTQAEKIKSASYEELLSIEGFGEVIANNIVKYFSDEKNAEQFDRILKILDIKEILITEEDKPLKGKTFVITGDTYIFESRRALQDYIENLGGKASSSVSAKTAYLINNDSASASSKNKKARELNVPVITEQEFLDMYPASHKSTS